jgi:transposase
MGDWVREMPDERTIHDVVQLTKEGMKRRAIARALHISRNTVRQILEEHGKARTQVHSALVQPVRGFRSSKLDPFRGRIEELLGTYPDITAQRVFEILRQEKGYDGGYTVLRLLVRRLRPKPPPTPSLETPPREPGKMAECDWSEYPVSFTHAPSMTLQAFGYTLRWSTRKYFGFQESNGLHPLMDEHVHAFERFQGAAQKCTYDSQKPVVLRWEGNQPILNPRFVDFATYYEFGVVAVRHAPNRKPRVERSFWELVKSFFNGRTFRDYEDLKAQLLRWIDTVADLRPIKRMKRRTRMELFAEEQPLLRPLPRHPYDTARVLYKLCDISGFIAWDGNWYSLPYEYVTEILPVRVTEDELFVYKADLSCIARHARWPRGAQHYSVLPGHRRKNADSGPDLDQLRVAFDYLGEPANAFLAALEKRQPRSASYHARKILALREGFDTTDLLKALAHALEYGALEHTAVERILAVRAEPRRLDEYVAEASARKLSGIVAQSCTEPRDLAEYDALPCRKAPQSTTGETPCPSQISLSSEAPLPKSGDGSRGTSNASASRDST